jgi:hypothetical protein
MGNAAWCRSPTGADQPGWWRASFLLATLLAAAASRGAARADSASDANVFARGQQAVGLLSGYGWGHILSGSREDALDTETVPIFPRWSIGLTDVFGEGHFYQGNLEFSVEGIFFVETQPHAGSAFGGAPYHRGPLPPCLEREDPTAEQRHRRDFRADRPHVLSSLTRTWLIVDCTRRSGA